MKGGEGKQCAEYCERGRDADDGEIRKIRTDARDGKMIKMQRRDHIGELSIRIGKRKLPFNIVSYIFLTHKYQKKSNLKIYKIGR